MATKKTTAKAKKKLLPKDIEATMAAGDLAALQVMFASVDVEARGTYAKCTALSVRGCPPALARWLVDNGADLAAVDTWGNSALHAWARFRGADLQVLIDLGADVHAVNTSGDTALFAAADSKRLDAVQTLLAAGSDVHARNKSGLTALEYALQRGSNIDIARLAPIAEVLVAAGADKSEKAQAFVATLGKTFEFHRAGFNAELVDDVVAGLQRLYALFAVAPVAARRVHDGTSAITMTTTRWQDQHSELWDLLVPSSGAAATVQGEVVRIAGRIGDELHRNGGGNWDDGYRAMTRAFAEYVRRHVSIDAALLAEVDVVVDELVRRGQGDDRVLYRAAVAWVQANPTPVPLAPPSYRR